VLHGLIEKSQPLDYFEMRDNDYRIVIPQERFMEEPAVESREMVAFRGEAIGLPREREFRPSLEGLMWHRENWGLPFELRQIILLKVLIIYLPQKIKC